MPAEAKDNKEILDAQCRCHFWLKCFFAVTQCLLQLGQKSCASETLVLSCQRKRLYLF